MCFRPLRPNNGGGASPPAPKEEEEVEEEDPPVERRPRGRGCRRERPRGTAGTWTWRRTWLLLLLLRKGTKRLRQKPTERGKGKFN